jgi:hypothetical protein
VAAALGALVLGLVAIATADRGPAVWDRAAITFRESPASAGPPAVGALLPDATGVALPLRAGSLRFAVIGDAGRGDATQRELGAEMARWHERVGFTFVLMLGDNMYLPGAPEDFTKAFEEPYRALLDAGVTFYAANGNHDPPAILTYPRFNMNGRRYYSFTRSEGLLAPLIGRTVRFVAIDSVNLDRAQLDWLRQELGQSDSDWEICFFHHPIYTSGRYALQAARLRRHLEPVLVQYGAHVALAGHEHFYERIVPQRGILHFISGGGSIIRRADIQRTRLTSVGFDDDSHFLLMEIAGEELFFQAIGRTGQTIDAGVIRRLERPRPPPSLR